MTMCEVISDAFIVQNSRKDPENGARNLNSLAAFAFAIGAMIGCWIDHVTHLRARTLILYEYTLLVLILFLFILTLGGNQEPKIIQDRQ